MSEEAGGRTFFSNVRRSLETEDEIRLVSVGVDIGSSTSHLVFSRLVLERLDDRYVVSERKVVDESEVLLTPFIENAADGTTIDAAALGRFIDRQYELARVDPGAIDTGALILTGVAVRRGNARAIGELFASQAGKFVSVSAGDALEATLAAFGSGACARSVRESARVMNVDVGGGTSKIAVCEGGEIADLTAVDVGGRIVSFDAEGRVARIEPSPGGIRATVIGASQYAIQVSGSTIFVAPQDVLPLKNIPVVTPNLPLDAEALAVEKISESVRTALRRLDLDDGERAVALCYRWKGSATFGRLDAFCRGIVAGLANGLGRGLPLILVGDGDVGGLIGIHCREETRLSNPIVSIDGIALKEFDFIDIGALLETSGAVPVVIKSLAFPGSAALR